MTDYKPTCTEDWCSHSIYLAGLTPKVATNGTDPVQTLIVRIVADGETNSPAWTLGF